MDCEQMKKTRSEILPTETRGDLLESWQKNMQPLVDDGLNGPTIAKLVMPMSMPSRLAKDLDCLIVAEDAAMNDADEDTISDLQIDEGDDMEGCNQMCTERDKQTLFLKPRKWVDGEITILDSLRSCMRGKKPVVNEARLGLHKAVHYGSKNKCKLNVSSFSIDDANWYPPTKKYVDSIDQHAYVFQLFMRDDNMARGTGPVSSLGKK
ncbi:hypothetical protein M9H77_14324 [Catharanthus roseus]|uniref:Uncharacterized protein n=1 Tax=Catharanthus roseus TaxID=4058 RepID=A0ACC0BMS3_CATRO|nr:hypothetical protein M9H77_14324 [Catharanthus roseus]